MSFAQNLLKQSYTAGLALVAAFSFTACSDDDDDPAPITAQSIVDIASGDSRFDILTAALTQEGLVPTLSDLDGSYTVFAPTDDAFAGLLERLDITEEQLLQVSNLDEILKYHVIQGEVDAAAALTQDGTLVPTLSTGNSIIVDDINNTVLVNNATVVDADIQTDNGIIHVINRVLMPPQNIYDTIEDYGLTTLQAAVDAQPSIKSTLESSMTDVTLLAPTDAAFTTFLSDNMLTANALLADMELDEVLLNHVINGSVNASAVAGLTSASTLASDSLSIAVSGATITIDGTSAVTTANLLCSNGLIHIIDAVITPPPSYGMDEINNNN